MKIDKKSIVLILLFTLITFIIVKASSAYVVTIENIDSSNYPQIQVSFSLTGETEGLTGKNFSIYENGSSNNGPIVLLTPKPSNNKVDLFILLDKSGNTKDYGSIIKSNLKSLIFYMEEDGIDLKINLIDFGSNDTPQDGTIHSFASVYDFSNFVDSISFDESRPLKVYGLNKIYQIASSSARLGSDKVALIVSGSQFYDINMGDNTTYSTSETINKLASGDFTVFVAGYPFKQLHSLKSMNTEDASLSHSVSGGYLGGFSTDLTVVHDLLKKRAENRYILQFYSNVSGSGSAQLYVQNYFTESFSYSKNSSVTPSFIDTAGSEALVGHSVPIRIEVIPNGELINVVEMVYLNKSNQIIKNILLHKKSENTENNLVYTGEIPEGEFPSDFVKYYVKVYTPYNIIGSEDQYTSIPVFAYDEEITLKSTVVNNSEVIWRWEGKTVDMGERYQLWAGDEMIIETKEKTHTIPAGECNKYQVVKVRVLLKSNVDHPNAGDWSSFSRSGEVFVEGDGEITEKEGIEIMIQCLEEKQFSTINSYIQTEPHYSASKKLYINKMLYYMTGIIDPSLKSNVRLDRYSLLYYLMNFINTYEYIKYSNSTDLIPRSILYKIVTNANQSSDLSGKFANAIEELTRRIRGSSSF